MKPVVVQKYGGSSVADAERLRQVARRVVDTAELGYSVVVVISAMGKTTDELTALAKSVCAEPPRRELDMLLSAGERIACSTLAMAISDLGKEAISFTGSQCGIITNDRHTDARILEVRPYRVQDELHRGRVVIVAGYQGVSYKREVTTLGRGGSDTTAVAIAAALSAEYCEICSDVDGVYSADPNQIADAQHLDLVSYETMQELSRFGAKVLHPQAVDFARRSGILIHAQSAEQGGLITVIGSNDGDQASVGVAGLRKLVRLEGQGGPGQLNDVGTLLSDAEVTPLWARLEGGQPVVLISVEHCPDYPALRRAFDALSGGVRIQEDLEMASLVGCGIGDDPDHLQRLLALVDQLKLPILSIDAAALRLSLLLPAGNLDLALEGLHRCFIEERV
jgi:aspartate kinase